jgi:hypothetical protein
MKIILAFLGAMFFIGCGSEPDASATLIVDRPAFGDDSCVGVAGFEVTVSATGKAPRTERSVDRVTILDAASCRLPLPVQLADLDIEASVIVTVAGYDGSGIRPRVIGHRTIENLRQGDVRLQLEAVPQLRPQLLVFERGPLLGGTQVKDLETIDISLQQMGGEPLLTVTRKDAGVFMNPEPGAYGIERLAVGQAVNVTLTAPGQMIREKMTVGHNGRYFTLTP